MTNDQRRSSLWIPVRKDSKGIFLTHTHLHILPLTGIHIHMYTQTGTQIQMLTIPVGYFTMCLAIWSKTGQRLPLRMRGLICEENVCICKESKKIIVTAYVTGVD